MKTNWKNRSVWFARRNTAAFVIGVVLFSFLTMLAWNPALPGAAQADETPQVTPTTTELVITFAPQPTPIPQEWADNIEQTNGILVGTIILVIIIIGGTLHAITRDGNRPH